MSSDNPIGADNQQETAMRDPQRLYAELFSPARER